MREGAYHPSGTLSTTRKFYQNQDPERNQSEQGRTLPRTEATLQTKRCGLTGRFSSTPSWAMPGIGFTDLNTCRVWTRGHIGGAANPGNAEPQAAKT